MSLLPSYASVCTHFYFCKDLLSTYTVHTCVYIEIACFIVSIEIANVTEYLASVNTSLEGCFNDTNPPTKSSTVGK